MAKKAKKKTNPKKKRTAKRNPKRSKARKRNPAKRATRRAAPRKKNPKRSSAHRRTRNPVKRAVHAVRRRRNARRTRRRNPGWGNLEIGLMALAAGTAAALTSAWVNDAPLGNRGNKVQGGALLVEGAAAVYFIENPGILGAVLVGLFLVPIAKFVYNNAPALANPRPMGAPPALPSTTTVVVSTTDANGNAIAAAVPATDASGAPIVATMSALHRANVAHMRAMDMRYGGQTMAALHRGAMGALHGNVRSLHRPQMGALHHPTMSALPHRQGRPARVDVSNSSHAAAPRT